MLLAPCADPVFQASRASCGAFAQSSGSGQPQKRRKPSPQASVPGANGKAAASQSTNTGSNRLYKNRQRAKPGNPAVPPSRSPPTSEPQQPPGHFSFQLQVQVTTCTASLEHNPAAPDPPLGHQEVQLSLATMDRQQCTCLSQDVPDADFADSSSPVASLQGLVKTVEALKPDDRLQLLRHPGVKSACTATQRCLQQIPEQVRYLGVEQLAQMMRAR